MSKISVFVSYSWDSEEHKTRVQSFVDQLRRDNFEIYVDKNMSLGEEITRFMEDGVVKCDRVLLICTPKYKEKADNREGGVGYESRICTSEVYQNNKSKFIPILFEGTISSSFPVWIRGNLGIDLSDSNFMGLEYKKLVQDLKKNSYLTAANRITDGQIKNDKKVKTKIESVILSFFLCVFAFFLFPVIIRNFKFTIFMTFASLLVAIVSLVIFGIVFVKKKSWLTKLQSMVIFCASVSGMIFSYNLIKIPQPSIIPGNVEIVRERPETIKISAEDGLEIYYTLDGSDPKELEDPNNLYDMANPITFTLNKSTVISARTRFLFFWSEATERSYVFVKPPVTNTESTDIGSFYSENDMGNGGEFLLYDNRYIFRKYNSDSFSDGCFWLADALDGSLKKISFMYSDGTVEELFDDEGYGPLYFARGSLYMNKYINNVSHVYSTDLSHQSTKLYGEGEIIGVDDDMRYVIYKDRQKIYAIDADSQEVALIVEATGGVVGFKDSDIYFAISVESREDDLEKEYILQLKKLSLENQQETDLTYFTFTAFSSESTPIIERAQFVGDYIYFTYGTRGGTLHYYTGFVTRFNLFTHEMEKIVENSNTSDFLVTNADGEHYLYYFADEEYTRINVSSRIVDYPPAETLYEKDVFEDKDGLCFYGKNDEKHILIDAADYEKYGYEKNNSVNMAGSILLSVKLMNSPIKYSFALI